MGDEMIVVCRLDYPHVVHTASFRNPWDIGDEMYLVVHTGRTCFGVRMYCEISGKQVEDSLILHLPMLGECDVEFW